MVPVDGVVDQPSACRCRAAAVGLLHVYINMLTLRYLLGCLAPSPKHLQGCISASQPLWCDMCPAVHPAIEHTSKAGLCWGLTHVSFLYQTFMQAVYP